MFSTSDKSMYYISVFIAAVVFLIFIFMFVTDKRDTNAPVQVNIYSYHIATIDNCEYIRIDTNWIHKGNCNNPAHKEIK